ncbi:MAG: hypothetical protein QGH51_03485 [Planctomycetota bacterium]|jgi:hypothetical protein|nr:hypothetical protein [Planctomycetota bacterium]
MDSFHLISDFDGVWTEPAREYIAIQAKVVNELSMALGESPEKALERYEGFAAAVMENPDQYGWQARPDDRRLSSFVDEDFFCMPSAIGQFIDHGNRLEAGIVKEAILARHETITALMDHCFHSTCEEFRGEVEHDLTHGADRVLQWLVDHNVRVTWVTNAPTEKIIDWFSHHDFQVSDARETSPEEANLRVYGRAGKQWIGESNQTLDFCGRQVLVDRPHYREILKREQADLVVGDVLSLDLALPVQLKSIGESFAPRETALVWRRETPDWVLNSVGEGSEKVTHLIGHLTSLPRLVLGLGIL